MPIARVKTWSAGEVLTANDLNNEFNNITNNAVIEPAVFTQQVDLNGQLLILDGDSDTLIDASTDDTIDITVAGADDFRITTNLLTLLSGTSQTIESGNLTITAGNLTVTDGATTLADPGAHTNTVVTPLSVEAVTSGTPAAGIGTGILFKSESGDENPSNFGQLEFAATDVSAGSEDTYFQILTRVAGAALTATYRWVATGAFKAIFTHANSADRTYTLPNASGTIVVGGAGSGVVATADLKTATGSATAVAVSTYPAGEVTTTTDVTMNDYSFFPSLTTALTGGSDGTGSGDWQASAVADPSNTVGRVTISATAQNGGGGGATRTQTTTLRWRYVTASDSPELWIAYDETTGMILASWVSDDPTPNGVPGVQVPGCRSIRLTAADLVGLSEVMSQMSAAAAYIQSKGLKLQHQAYRALQLATGDAAPSRWFVEQCAINPTTGRLVQGAIRPPEPDAIPKAVL